MHHPNEKEGCFNKCRYRQRCAKQGRDKFKRTDWTAECKNCGWEGQIY